MLDLLKCEIKNDFIGKKLYIAYILSILFAVAVVYYVTNGGLDGEGGYYFYSDMGVFYPCLLVIGRSLSLTIEKGFLKYEFSSVRSRWNIWNIKYVAAFIHIVAFSLMGILFKIVLRALGLISQLEFSFEDVNIVISHIVALMFCTSLVYLVSISIKKPDVILIFVCFMSIFKFFGSVLVELMKDYKTIFSIFKHTPTYLIYINENSTSVPAYIELIIMGAVLYFIGGLVYSRIKA